jgi:hypothetical protein
MTAVTGEKTSRAKPARAGKPAGARPFRRRLFYVAGFDPASPKKYHRLYTEQGAKQAALTGVKLTVGELRKIDEVTSGGSVTAEHPDGARAEVDYRFLHWFEAVRGAWPKDGPGLFVGFWRALGDYYASGLMARCKTDARAAWMASLAATVASAGLLVLYAVLVGLICWAGAALAVRFGAPWQAGAVPPLLLWLLLMHAWRLVDRVLHLGWIGRGMIGVTRAARGLVPDFAARSDAFAARIAEAARDPDLDEVLVVSHSMGGQQACRAVGRAILEDPEFGARTPVNLLTVGSLLPFYSFCAVWAGEDPAYLEEMAALVGCDRVPWVDVTAPNDPGCAAALHPLCGLDLGEPETRPVRRAPKFNRLLTRPSFDRLKAHPLDYHFQYIMAGEQLGEYDFFALTAGPAPLVERPAP